MASCLRVYRKGSSTCDQPGEICCQGGNFSDRYAPLTGAGGPFVLYATQLGPDTGRRRALPVHGGRGGPVLLCPIRPARGRRSSGRWSFVSTTKGGETLRALRRCYGGGSHAYALTASCPAGTKLEAVLGYVR